MKTTSNTSYSLRALPRTVDIYTYTLFSRAFQGKINISTVHVVVSIAIPNQANTTMYSNQLQTKRNDQLIINNIHTDRYIGRVNVTSNIYTISTLQIPKVTATSNRNVFDAGQQRANQRKQTTHIHEETKTGREKGKIKQR